MSDKQSQDILAKLNAAFARLEKLFSAEMEARDRGRTIARRVEDDMLIGGAVRSAIEAIRERDERIAELEAKLNSLVDPDQPRPTVRWMAGLMEAKLRKHDEVQGYLAHWYRFTMDFLLARLRGAVDELAAAIDWAQEENTPGNGAMDGVISGAVDVATFATIIACYAKCSDMIADAQAADVAAHSAGDIECAEDGEQ